MIKYLFGCICLLLIGVPVADAQIAEEIVTESSILDEEPDPRENDLPLDDVVAKRALDERLVLDYKTVTESDLFWSRRLWQVIDVREKLNQPFTYPNAPFFKLLVDGIKNGNLTAYSNIDDKFTTPLSPESVQEMLTDVDTIMVTNLQTYEDELKVITNDLDFSKINKFRIKEVWFFDSKSSTLDARILGIAPVQEIIDDDTGQYLGENAMFWVYYPHARNYLSNHKVFIPGNDANPLSWEDYLEMRFFNSYVYKVSNVHDLALRNYPYLEGDDLKSGIQRLIESEKIKEEIFNFEHDLWSY